MGFEDSEEEEVQVVGQRVMPPPPPPPPAFPPWAQPASSGQRRSDSLLRFGVVPMLFLIHGLNELFGLAPT